MNNQNKKTAIVFALNDTYAFCSYASICSLKKHSPKLVQQSDILIYVCDMTDTNKKALNTLNVKIINYNFPLSIKQTKEIKAFSLASFARYECFNLLNNYENVIYLDSDILVQKELSDVFDLVKDTGFGLIKEKVKVEVCKKNKIEGFDLSKQMFNSGFFILTRKFKLNFNEITNYCYIKTAELCEKLYLPDQAILNLAIKHFNIIPNEIPMLFNTPASLSTKILKEANIIHFTGHRKPWNYYYFDEFYKYYKQWIINGGTPIDKIRKDSKVYKYLLQMLSLNKFIFFQLCPDFIKKPIKAIRFFIKFIFKIKY
ncbi:MAG: hypothetical protein IKO48_06170 [Elusimicrobia bacterium]|nr:hypothetical protein [Elusimicrobiota bacterium]